MMKGQINATVVDLANKNKLMEMGEGKFHVLPGVSEVPSDELVFANEQWIEEHSQAVSIVVEELLKLWNEMNDNPAIIEEERAKRDLLTDQPKELLAAVVPFRSDEHTSELQSLMRISYAVFCLKKKRDTLTNITSCTNN